MASLNVKRTCFCCLNGIIWVTIKCVANSKVSMCLLKCLCCVAIMTIPVTPFVTKQHYNSEYDTEYYNIKNQESILL